MALYMTQFSYTSEAWAAMVKTPSDRGKVLRAFIEKMGGKMIGIWFCFGEYDGVGIFEMPDNVAAMGMVLGPNVQGFLKATKTTVLFSMEEGMEAMRMTGKVVYPAPE